MEQRLLQVGAVYVEPHDPDRPRRVLAFDDDMVMYDAWWSDIDG